jgi:hypothetical protein
MRTLFHRDCGKSLCWGGDSLSHRWHDAYIANCRSPNQSRCLPPAVMRFRVISNRAAMWVAVGWPYLQCCFGAPAGYTHERHHGGQYRHCGRAVVKLCARCLLWYFLWFIRASRAASGADLIDASAQKPVELSPSRWIGLDFRARCGVPSTYRGCLESWWWKIPVERSPQHRKLERSQHLMLMGLSCPSRWFVPSDARGRKS